MSEEADPRECDEPFESEEGDIEPYPEVAESSADLLERLRELEAENSALAVANESQRETYERCLDEVANHVVQALLNQKDLREECIKLKMRVFDLERQNRTLAELFQQKLHSQPSMVEQVLSLPFPEHNSERQLKGPDKAAVVHCEVQAENGADGTANGTAGTRAPPTSMEALSPFFKKKAHILEVLRRLEETDPLKFYPSSGFSSYHDFSQPLMPTETITDPGGVPRPCKIHQSCCHLSCSDPEAHDYMNGEAELQEDHNQEDDGTSKLCMHRMSAEPRPLYRGHRDGKPDDPPPLMSADSYLHSLFKDVSQNVNASGEPEEKAALPEDSQSLSCHEERCSKKDSSFAILMQCTSPAREALEPVLTENMKCMSTGDFQTLSTGQVIGTEECCDEMEAETANEKIGLCASSSNMPVTGVSDNSQIAYIEQESNELICNRLFFSSNETSFSKKVAVESYSPAPVPQKNGTTHQPGPEKPKLALSPTSSSCRDEVKPSPISSPSRLLKFLKIPSIGDRTQAANSVRLSPQLTRSSKIPCRNNNYEVYHSPVMVRKTTLNERDRQPPSPKTDMYPATHSAPTSPPKPEDACSPTVKEISYSSHSAPKASRSTKLVSLSEAQKGFQNVFHYENVSEVSTSCNVEELPQYLDRMNVSHFLSLTQNEDPNEKQPKSPEEKVLSPHFIQQTNLSPTADTVGAVTHSDSDSDTESAAWYRLHNHHSLPISSASHKAQSNCNYSSMRQHDKGPADTSSESSEPAETPVAAKKSEPPSIPKKPVVGKPPSESSHHLFKERLAALGKLKSAEDLQVGAQSTDKKDVQYMGKAVSSSNCEKAKTAEKQNDRNAAAEQRHTKYIDSLDGKPNSKNNIGGYSMKFPGPCQPYDVGAKSLTTSCSAPKAELETLSSRIYVAKADGPKMKVCISSSNPDPPQVLRNYMKCNTSQNLPHSSKTVPSPQSSPTKVSSKSPSKPGQASSNPRGAKPIQDDRNNCQKPSPRSEDKSKLTASKKKNPTYAESLLPTSPRPSDVIEDKRPFVVGPQSSIEQKVMKGIEENMLKLQEQDRGQTSEVKQKASNGIASWFGLKKSKLPALNRKPEVSKLKLNMSSMGKDPKTAAKKKLEVESLNISKLMEKAEDLRKALEEERAYVNGVALSRQGRGHSCEVMMDQAQGQLAVMHSGVASDNFMQQLLNRVDERDTASFGTPHRRLSFDSKKSRPIFSHQKNGINHTTSGEEMEKGSDLVSKDVASHENLAESMNSQHFTGSGASMRTLDSGIGTFPLPDYASGAAGKSIPKIRPQGDLESAASHCKLGPMTRVPRKARTLERELSSLEEVNPCALYTSALDGKGSSIRLSSTIHEDVNAYEADMRCSSSKNWTFPNLKASAGPADVYLDVKEEGQPATHGTSFKRSLKPCGPPVPCEADPSSLPLPPQMGLGSRGKGQIPSTPEMSKDGGLEMMKDRLEEIISPSRPQALETPESLSDSLYDSLSSCGSQG